MSIIDHLAEERLKDAIEKGEFDDLPGKGEPLRLEDLSRIPEELRSSYLMLKNAGVLPEELVLRKELVSLQRMLVACRDDEQRSEELRAQLNDVELRFLILLEHRLQRHIPNAYRGKLARRRLA